MVAEELRGMSANDIEGHVRDLRQQLFKLRFQKTTGQVANAAASVTAGAPGVGEEAKASAEAGEAKVGEAAKASDEAGDEAEAGEEAE